MLVLNWRVVGAVSVSVVPNQVMVTGQCLVRVGEEVLLEVVATALVGWLFTVLLSSLLLTSETAVLAELEDASVWPSEVIAVLVREVFG